MNPFQVRVFHPQGSEGFREATVSKGGLGVLQRLLSAGSGAASRVKRRALTLVGDLARRARVMPNPSADTGSI